MRLFPGADDPDIHLMFNSPQQTKDGERSLALAVLESGILELTEKIPNSPIAERSYALTWYWVFIDNTDPLKENRFLPFKSLCEKIDLDYTYVRSCLRKCLSKKVIRPLVARYLASLPDSVLETVHKELERDYGNDLWRQDLHQQITQKLDRQRSA